MAAYADEIICLPTRMMTENDADYSVAFAIPADAEGVRLITHVTNPKPREKFKAPAAEYGFADSFVIFDDLFALQKSACSCAANRHPLLDS